MGAAMPKVTLKALAALVPEAEALCEAPVAVADAPVEDVPVDSTPDLVTANVCDWLIMPLFVPTLPRKLTW